MKRWLLIGLFVSGAASFATTDAQVREQASTFVSEARAAVSDFVARQAGSDGDDGAIARSSDPAASAVNSEAVAPGRMNAATVTTGIARVTLKPVSSPSSAASLAEASTQERVRSVRGTSGVVVRPVRRDRESAERDVASAARGDAVVRAFSRAQVAVVEIREPSIARESLAPQQDLSPRELLPSDDVTTVEQEAVRPSSPADADQPEQATSDEVEDTGASRNAAPVVPLVSKAGAARKAARARLLRERRARQQRARQKKARQRAAAKRRARVRANARKRRRAQNRARARARARRAARSSRARRPLVKIKRKCFRYGGCDTYVSFRRPRTRAEAARLSRIRNRIIAERLRRRRLAY